ncbi:MAG: RidA family protein [Desulfurococcaceae archaeon]
MKKIIRTSGAPKPIGPYSQGVCVNGWLFVSGQVPIDPTTGDVVEGDFKAKVKRVLENVKSIVEASGGTLQNVVKVTVFLKDISKFQAFNEVYSEYFGEDPPARSAIGVSGLPRNSDLEVEAIAYVEECK